MLSAKKADRDTERENQSCSSLSELYLSWDDPCSEFTKMGSPFLHVTGWRFNGMKN
jgi:hypothetical protein